MRDDGVLVALRALPAPATQLPQGVPQAVQLFPVRQLRPTA